jgi:hypothetical protein
MNSASETCGMLNKIHCFVETQVRFEDKQVDRIRTEKDIPESNNQNRVEIIILR